MMLTAKVEKAMNDQLAEELQSAYEYLSMSAYAESISFPGFATWLRVQWQEEIDHALRFYTFILDRDGQVDLQPIKKPRSDYKSILDVFESSLKQEKAVSASIHNLYELVERERDYAAQAWLNWFATEQVEEEKMVGQIVDSLKRIGERGDGLFILDKELGSRQPDETN
jgi:ferritin